MSKTAFYGRTQCGRRLTAAIFFATTFTAYSSLAAQTVPRLPDLTAYDCSAVSQATAATTLHIGQVVNGTYNEWYESYVTVNGQQRLACLSLIRPTSRQLGSHETAAFLTASYAVGAPNAGSEDVARAAAASTVDVETIENVQPEPMKHVREPAASAEGTPKTAAGENETPPLPASKKFDGSESAASPSFSKSPALASEDTARPNAAGTDERTAVTATQNYPWNTVAYLQVAYPGGANYRCTATIISPYTVLTAGHCVHNRTRGGYITSARVYPGQSQPSLGSNQAIRPYGVKSDVSSVQTTQEWTQISGNDTYPTTDYRHDFAAIEFTTPFTHTSTFMPVLYGSVTTPVTAAGYPAVVQGGSNFGLYADTDAETSRSASTKKSHVREFAVDASGGNSGGPFIYTNPTTGQSYLVGSLSYGDELDDRAGGPWYDSWNYELLNSWVSWRPGRESIAGSTTGLRVASVYGSQQHNFVSYLRFYNDGATAGTVDVTLADYATGNILGTWRSPSLAARSSRQFSIAEIEDDTNVPFEKAATYSVSIRPTFSGSFQNALWSNLTGSLSNLSTCSQPSASSGHLIMNFHSSLLDNGYPSVMIVHNTSAAAAQPQFTIVDAATGASLGTFSLGVMAGNTQKVLTAAQIEAAAGISPNGRYHYNIRAEGTFDGYMQHLLNNQNVHLVTDMTANCQLSP